MFRKLACSALQILKGAVPVVSQMFQSCCLAVQDDIICSKLNDMDSTISLSESPDNVIISEDVSVDSVERQLQCDGPESEPESEPDSSCVYCCDSPHPRSACPARHTVCSFCRKPGHFRCACKKLARLPSPPAILSAAAVAASTNSPSSLSRSIVPVLINGREVSALIDTGSTSTFIDASISRHLGLNTTPQNFGITLASSNSVARSTELAHIPTLQMCNNTYQNLRISVLPQLCCDMIIGHDLLSHHGCLVMNFSGNGRDFVVDTARDAAANSHATCSVALAKIEPPPLFSDLSGGCRPIACKSRRYSEEDTSFIREEIAKLLEANIIEPCRSPWRAQVLVTKDDRHKKRMVVDYSRTVNKFTNLDAFPLPRIDDMAFEVSRTKIYSTFDLKSAYHQVPILESERPYTAFEGDGHLYQFTRIPFGVTNGVSAFQRIISGIIKDEKLENTWAYLDNVTIGGLTQLEHDKHVARFRDLVRKYNLTLNEDKTIASVEEISMLGYAISYLKVRPDPERMQPLLNLPLPTDAKSLKRSLGLFSYYSQWIQRFSDKVRPLTQNTEFPLHGEAVSAFQNLKKDIVNASLSCPNSNDTLVVETDASDIALSAILNQNGRPIAFFSRTLQPHERKHPSIEKEAAAIVEACRKWRHYLCGKRFRLITDQQAVSFVFDGSRHGKTKNDKIERWRVELSCFDFEIQFRPGVQNASADCLSRAICSAASNSEQRLVQLHEGLAHPGIARMYHFLRSRNLPYTMQEVKAMTARCRTCAEIKPRFFKPNNPPLIKATQPFERISIDFKGTLPHSGRFKYILTIVDEYSRFPFAYPCTDQTASTAIKHLDNLFSIFGLPGYVHSDRGPAFISDEYKNHLLSLGVPFSKSAAYNPRGNGQVERYNGIVWKGVELALHSRKLGMNHWETVLPSVLHSIRTLVCTATNRTPHERLFGFQRRTLTGHALPAWIATNSKALVRKHVRASKYDPWVEECEIVHATPTYAQIKTASGKEQTVSLRDLAPLPTSDDLTPELNTKQDEVDLSQPQHIQTYPHAQLGPYMEVPSTPSRQVEPVTELFPPVSPTVPSLSIEPSRPSPPSVQPPRRSGRNTVPIVRLNYENLGGT